jgi:hypothetical protein
MDGVQVFKFFVVVHDVAVAGRNLTQAKELLNAVKKAYGPHSALLVINSRGAPAESPATPTAPTTSDAPPLPPKDGPGPGVSAWSDPARVSGAYAAAMSSLALAPLSAIAQQQDQDQGTGDKTYAALLGAEDIWRIAALVRELVVQSLVPWMEARVREWNEAYQSNRRGLTGRIFGAGRKLFGGSRPTSPSPAKDAGYNATKG